MNALRAVVNAGLSTIGDSKSSGKATSKSIKWTTMLRID